LRRARVCRGRMSRLPCDFDGGTWRLDAAVYAEAAAWADVPAAVETSRSGDGAHLASLHNPEFYSRQQIRLNVWGAPRMLRCYSESLDRLFLPRGVAGFEVKAGSRVQDADLSGLRLLRDRLGERFIAGFLLNLGELAYRKEERILVMPLSGLWSLASSEVVPVVPAKFA
jgi:hypothetical protein